VGDRLLASLDKAAVINRDVRTAFHSLCYTAFEALSLEACHLMVLSSQANMGAKNHLVAMPDADKGRVVNALTGAAFGAAGQRCMAVSVAVLVGGTAEWEERLAVAARKLKVRTCVAAAYIIVQLPS
jgi:hypothetical protein